MSAGVDWEPEQGASRRLRADTGTLQTRDDIVVASWMQIADGTRPETPVEISGDGLGVCLEREGLPCRGLAPVLLGWLGWLVV